MKNSIPIAVTSRSFSRHPVLRKEILDRYSDVKFNDEGLALSGQQLVEFARNRKKLITALETIDESFLAATPELEVISKYGVGLDMIDLDAMIRHNIRLGWKGGVNKRSVSELTIAFMISLLRLIPRCQVDLRNGNWKNLKGLYLTGRTIGVIGCGHIGKDLIQLLNPFGCKILVNDIRDYSEFYRATKSQPVSLEDLLRKSDIVTLHVPLDDSTLGILSADRLTMMKEGAFLINTARGDLVDEKELKNLLITRHLAGAAFDVFSHEPADDLEILQLPNFLATPHIGGSAEEAILAMGRAAIAGLEKPCTAYSGRNRINIEH